MPEDFTYSCPSANGTVQLACIKYTFHRLTRSQAVGTEYRARCAVLERDFSSSLDSNLLYRIGDGCSLRSQPSVFLSRRSRGFDE